MSTNWLAMAVVENCFVWFNWFALTVRYALLEHKRKNTVVTAIMEIPDQHQVLPQPTRARTFIYWFFYTWEIGLPVFTLVVSVFAPIEVGFLIWHVPKSAYFRFDVAFSVVFTLELVLQAYLTAIGATHGSLWAWCLFGLDYFASIPWVAICKRFFIAHRHGKGKHPGLLIFALLRVSGGWRGYRILKYIERLRNWPEITTMAVDILLTDCYVIHFEACVLHLLSQLRKHSWLTNSPHSNHTPAGEYVFSLYFSAVTMATIGYGDVHAVSTMEMIWVVISVMSNLIINTYFGFITAALMARLRAQAAAPDAL